MESLHFPDISFKTFLFGNRLNRWFLGLGIGISIVVWIIFKHWYPNADIVFDSYYYIGAALHNDNVSAWPIGYSKFLRLVGFFSHTTTAVVVCQYLLLQISLFLFFFTMTYFFSFRVGAKVVLFLFVLLNPIYIYTCNFILSDALFLAISVVWLVQLMWIVFKPRPWMIFTQALLLLAAFAIRQSALFYPFIGILAFILSKQRIVIKIAGMLLGAVLVVGFIHYTTRENEKLYGVSLFSPFQGWKVANNALYVYGHVAPLDRDLIPAKFQRLDSVVQEYYHTQNDTVDILNADPSSGCYYIFMPKSPLRKYHNMIFGMNPGLVININGMAKLGRLYGEYGKYILRKHPLAYFHWFVLPCSYTYIIPYPEAYIDSVRSEYSRFDTLTGVAQNWFRNLKVDVPNSMTLFRIKLFEQYGIFVVLTHALFVLGIIGYLLLGGRRNLNVPKLKMIMLMVGLWGMNFIFIILAAASVYRFQLFILVIEFSFSVNFFNHITKSTHREYDYISLEPRQETDLLNK